MKRLAIILLATIGLPGAVHACPDHEGFRYMALSFLTQNQPPETEKKADPEAAGTHEVAATSSSDAAPAPQADQPVERDDPTPADRIFTRLP